MIIFYGKNEASQAVADAMNAYFGSNPSVEHGTKVPEPKHTLKPCVCRYWYSVRGTELRFTDAATGADINEGVTGGAYLFGQIAPGEISRRYSKGLSDKGYVIDSFSRSETEAEMNEKQKSEARRVRLVGDIDQLCKQNSEYAGRVRELEKQRNDLNKQSEVLRHELSESRKECFKLETQVKNQTETIRSQLFSGMTVAAGPNFEALAKHNAAEADVARRQLEECRQELGALKLQLRDLGSR